MKARQNLICSIMIICLCFSVIPALHVSAEEQGNTKSTAKVITSGKNYDGMVEDKESAWYKYTVKETGYIVLNLKEKEDTISHWLASWQMTVIVNNKKLLDTVYTDSEFKSAKLGLKKGTVVYIQVLGGYNSKNVPYLFSLKNTKSSSWESEVNDTQKKANTIKANKKYYGNSYYGYPSIASEKDYFKFKATKKGKLNIYFGRKEIGTASCSFDLTVYVKSKEKASVYTRNAFEKAETIDVNKGDTVYLIATSTASYIDYALMVKYK